MTAGAAQPFCARPTWLSLDPDPVLAFLHAPESGGRSTAVLLCPPFGWEENCSYRGRRTWAQELARAGFPSARIDLPGTGDSGGAPRDPERLQAWTAAVTGAADWLREATSARRVVSLGIGLGGMLACRAVSDGAAIDDLILCGVPAQGRLLLRELRAYARVIAARNPEDAERSPLDDGDLELIGFLMDTVTAQALEAVDLTERPWPEAPARRVLLLGRDGLAVDKRLRAHLEAAGVSVAVEAASDYHEMMAAHPQNAKPPLQTIQKTVEWLCSGPSGQRDGEPTASSVIRASAAGGSAELRWGGVAVRETPLSLKGQSGECFGVLTEPVGSDREPICAVWLNGGALRHTGPNRAWVEIARRWAARGVPTVRVDLEGIGDSDGEDVRLLSNLSLYSSPRTQQTLSILDQLAALGLPDRFVLGGLCSGAYWSLHAALADSRVVGAMMINLYAFYWSEALVAEREPKDSLSALQTGGWRRLFRRDVRGDELKRAILSVQPTRIRNAAGRPVERAQTDQIELALQRLSDKGTEALLLLSQGEPLSDQLERMGVLDRLERWPNLSVEPIPSRDHMFRALRLQRQVHSSLDGTLDRVLESARVRG